MYRVSSTCFSNFRVFLSSVAANSSSSSGSSSSAPNAIKTYIQSLVTSTPLVIFMKGTPQAPMCGYSRSVVNALNSFQQLDTLKLKTVNVLEDSGIREEIKKYTHWPTIPQVFVGGEFVGGCDAIMEMFKNGELAQKLKKAQVLPNDDNDSFTKNSAQQNDKENSK